MAGRPTKKLTAAQRRAKRERRRSRMRVFINGKQTWVRREPTIDGLPVDEFIARNADPIWLHQNELWELMPATGETGGEACVVEDFGDVGGSDDEDVDVPF
jgi:hypothetical protein